MIVERERQSKYLADVGLDAAQLPSLDWQEKATFL